MQCIIELIGLKNNISCWSHIFLLLIHQFFKETLWQYILWKNSQWITLLSRKTPLCNTTPQSNRLVILKHQCYACKETEAPNSNLSTRSAQWYDITKIPRSFFGARNVDGKVCIGDTFRSNIRSLLLKLLCTLARLCEGILLQPLRLNLFGINFPLHPCSQFPFITFRGQVEQQNKGKDTQSPWVLSAPQPSHPHNIAHPPPHIPIIHRQGKRVSRHFTSPSTAGGLFPLHFAKCTHLILPLLLSRRDRGGGVFLTKRKWQQQQQRWRPLEIIPCIY